MYYGVSETSAQGIVSCTELNGYGYVDASEPTKAYIDSGSNRVAWVARLYVWNGSQWVETTSVDKEGAAKPGVYYPLGGAWYSLQQWQSRVGNQPIQRGDLELGAVAHGYWYYAQEFTYWYNSAGQETHWYGNTTRAISC